MKKLMCIIFFIPTLLFSKSPMDDREISLIDPRFKASVMGIISALQSDRLGPTKEIERECDEAEANGGGEPCIVDGNTIISCSKEFKSETVLCYNGNWIAKTPPNILMMDYLCNDTEFFGPPDGLHLGTCDPDIHKDLLRVEEKVSCDCRTKKNGRHGWVCFNKDPKIKL